MLGFLIGLLHSFSRSFTLVDSYMFTYANQSAFLISIKQFAYLNFVRSRASVQVINYYAEATKINTRFEVKALVRIC